MPPGGEGPADFPTGEPSMEETRIQGTIRKVSGPLVVADGMREAKMFDVVLVSDEKLIGFARRLASI